MSHSSLPSRISFFCEPIFARTSLSTCSSTFNSAVMMVTISWRMVSRSSTKSTSGFDTRKSMIRWESRTVFSRLKRISAEDQFPFPRELALHLLEHLLVRDSCPLHLVRVLGKDFANLLVQPVLDRDFFRHHLPDLRRQVVRMLGLDHLGGSQPLDDFLGHVSDVVARQKHFGSLSASGVTISV